MSKKIGKAAAIALALASSAARAAETTLFEASVDRDEMALDETLTLTVVLSSDHQPSKMSLPDQKLRDFEVLGRSQSEQVSFVYGGGASRVQRVRNFIF